MKKIFCLLFCFLSIVVFGQLRLPNIIADNMVLQQKKTNKIWGWCNPKEKITVNFYHKNYQTISNDAGEWALYLSALPAGVTSNLIVSTSTEKIICKNVIPAIPPYHSKSSFSPSTLSISVDSHKNNINT